MEKGESIGCDFGTDGEEKGAREKNQGIRDLGKVVRSWEK